MNLLEFQQNFHNEEDCIAFLEDFRWGGNPVCPKCGCVEIYRITTRKIYKCSACGKQFSVRTGTVFEESLLPLTKWFLAIYLLTSLKKGISSVQLGKYLGITQKSAWFLLQRVRHVIESGSFDKPLSGTVEIDETYVGGKHHDGKRGRGASGKTPVVGVVEREGSVRTKVTVNTKAKAVQTVLRNHVEIGSRVMTDEYRSYSRVKDMGFEHNTVRHGSEQFVLGDAHTNTIEGYWSHLKRGIDAIYMRVSPKHLQLYCNEYEYRYNTRGMTDGRRFSEWFNYCGGRLTYKKLTAQV